MWAMCLWGPRRGTSGREGVFGGRQKGLSPGRSDGGLWQTSQSLKRTSSSSERTGVLPTATQQVRSRAEPRTQRSCPGLSHWLL